LASFAATELAIFAFVFLLFASADNLSVISVGFIFFRIKSFLHPIRCKFVVCLRSSVLKKQEAVGDFGGRELESA
jgi:hypothetical protein